MNKKDLSYLRKEFKLNSYMLSIKEVYSVYLKKDNGDVIAKELDLFEMMDVEKQELYLGNFKKILTGTIDSKIFELDFKSQIDDLENTHGVLYTALNSENNIEEYADKIVNKITENYMYDTDVVINFMKLEYYKTNKKASKEAEEAADDFVQSMDLILCSINKVDIPKKVLKFDYKEKIFKPSSALDMAINSFPLDGFMFPCFNDINKILYYSSKAKQINFTFAEDILDCNTKPTAIEEKESFNAILNTVIGDRVKPGVIQGIYEAMKEKLEDQEDDEEELVVNIKGLQKILESSNIENPEATKGAFEDICGGDYEFKIKNILPDFYSKSIKIENETTSIEITPRELSSIRQIRNKKGKKCLLIELNDDVDLNGFKLELENEEI